MMNAFDTKLVESVEKVFGIKIRGTHDGGFEDADLFRNFFLEQTVPFVHAETSAQAKLAAAVQAMRSATTADAITEAQQKRQEAERDIETASQRLGQATDIVLILFGRGSHEGYVRFMDEVARLAQRQLVAA